MSICLPCLPTEGGILDGNLTNNNNKQKHRFSDLVAGQEKIFSDRFSDLVGGLEETVFQI